MISVTIVGSGNVAYHLTNSFLQSEQVLIKQLFTRNQNDSESWKQKIPTINSLELLENSDVTILAVSDDSIEEVSQKIKNSFVVHTSGSKSIQDLKNKTRRGVFYPLQSFSKEREVDFSGVPLCLEAENDTDLNLLKELSQALGSKFYEIDSHQRKYIHVAAVFANNFSNHMYQQAYQICQSHDVPFEVLLPLIQETADKIQSLIPLEAQTGPAMRNDEKTIEKHLNLLSSTQKELYHKITKSIKEHGKKL